MTAPSPRQLVLQAAAAFASALLVFWAVAAPGSLAPVAVSATAPPDAVTATAADGPAYRVIGFDFAFLRRDPGLPTAAELFDLPLQLVATPTGYIAPPADLPADAPSLMTTLGGIAGLPPAPGSLSLRDASGDPLPGVMLHASAVNAAAAAVVRAFNDRGLIGVLVSPDPDQIEVAFDDDGTPRFGNDRRAPGNSVLRLLVRTNVVGEQRTVARGDRLADGDGPINHPMHRRILERSPLSVGDPIDRNRIDRYLFDLNRHPGRSVAVSVAAGRDPAAGDTTLDYLVAEAKPWTAFFNLSNTGTRDTRTWRQRFGLLNTQLTGRDDILSLEYVTAGFDESHALFASYERPFDHDDRLHWRAYATFQDFEASDVGFPGADFSGTEFGLGGELIWNFWQRGPSFLDLVGGARWESVHVDNSFAAIQETEPFFVPYVGVGFENTTQVNTTTAYLGVEFNLADTDEPDVDGLGRFDTDANWVKFPFRVAHSFYLEPVLNRDDWLDIQTPGSTLAHEVFLALRGQWAPSSRLNPQAQQTLGGLYTVRGYDEAITAGDTVVIATAEYRLHVPRLFTPTPGSQRAVAQLFGEPFRTFPQQPYGAADWDLVGKAFLDVGRSLNNDRQAFEQNETLVGVGLGVDFLFKRNANFTVDWGVALNDAAGTTDGSQQWHFSFTLLY
ncbi:MAG: hypothetical protein AAF710_02220 [Planctomycetota bacterium]